MNIFGGNQTEAARLLLMQSLFRLGSARPRVVGDAGTVAAEAIKALDVEGDGLHVLLNDQLPRIKTKLI